MSNRARLCRLFLSLVGYLVFMIVLLAVLGAGVGTPELLIWLAILAAGGALIVRGHRSRASGPKHLSQPGSGSIWPERGAHL